MRHEKQFHQSLQNSGLTQINPKIKKVDKASGCFRTDLKIRFIRINPHYQRFYKKAKPYALSKLTHSFSSFSV